MTDPAKIQVLLIEDNPGDARLIREALAAAHVAGFELEWVQRLGDGLAAIGARKPDVVLLDLSLPDSQGVETVVKIQQTSPAVPIVVLTGMDDQAVALEAVHRGAQDYLSKSQAQGDSSFLARAIRYAIERKRVEEAVRLSEERFQIVVRATDDAVRDWDLASNQVWWNDAIRTRFRYAQEQIGATAAWWIEQIHPEERERVVQGIRRAIDTGERTWSDEYRFRRGDGTYGYVLDRGRVVHDAHGTPVRMIGAMMDITERKQGEQALARLASFAERNPNPVIETDQDGRVTYLNPAATARFPGLAKASGQHPILEGLTAVAATLERTGQPAFVREALVGERSYEQHVTYEPDQGVIRSFVIDITDRKQVERLKDEFLSMVSHELRTPLATIKEFIGIIADKLAGPISPDQDKYLGIVKANIDRLARMINDVLDMAKIESGRILLNKEVIKTDQLLEHVVQSIRPLAQNKGVELAVEAGRFFPDLYADPDKVTQVLVNLIGNAIKFTPGPGRVAVMVEELDSEIRFAVKDTGVGIDAQDLPRLFEKFQQFRRMSPDVGSTGSGLGLAITKRFVELHGGRVWVESEPGRGSTFYVAMPRYHVGEVFRDYLKSGLTRARTANSHLSMITVGVEDFDRLRSQFGAQAAGSLLNAMERIIREHVRLNAGDAVVRWQNGDVIVVLADVDQAGCLSVASRIKQLLESEPYVLQHSKQQVRVATHTATYPDSVVSEDEFLRMAEAGMPSVTRKSPRILVTDDEPKIRHFLKEVLELQGFQVLTAASGPDALDQLKSQAVDLVLLDVMMPVMDGYQVYHLLRENPQTRDLPVLIITGQGERTDRLLGMDTPTYNYLMKPFEVEELIGKIRELLGQSAVPAAGSQA
jgi:PAS domain S-box-containing protein/diguanylate cyclase (GGDEF)-like protein